MTDIDNITELTEGHWSACALECPAVTGGTCAKDRNEECSGSWGSKFDSAAAEILWTWSLDTNQDAECGNAVDGDAWYALFREDRAVLQTMSSGAVFAWRIDADKDLDTEWAAIEATAYVDDSEDDSED